MLSRAHILFGDYYTAMKVLDPVASCECGENLNKRNVLSMRVPICHITMHFHQGFAQMMNRRYVDAIKSFSTGVLYISRNKQYFSRMSNSNEINKWNDKMLALLAISVSLCPGQRVDENVHSTLREKYSEKMLRMQRGEMVAFDETFSYACPKFILPSMPDFDRPSNQSQEAYQIQVRIFEQEVSQQLQLPTIRSYLKLYRSIELKKLAGFRDMKDEHDLVKQLLAHKHKTFQMQADEGGSSVGGSMAPSSDVHFYISDSMVHIDETERETRYGEFFISHVHKFEEVISDVTAITFAEKEK
jgi:translation initiation factor 3 subunit L